MNLLLTIHSYFRWIIVFAGAYMIIRYAIGWLRKAQFVSADKNLGRIFPILMDIQVLIGIIILIWEGVARSGIPNQRVEHTITLLIAAVVAHFINRWDSPDDPIRFRNRLILLLLVFILIFFGVAALPGGFSRWT